MLEAYIGKRCDLSVTLIVTFVVRSAIILAVLNTHTISFQNLRRGLLDVNALCSNSRAIDF